MRYVTVITLIKKIHLSEGGRLLRTLFRTNIRNIKSECLVKIPRFKKETNAGTTAKTSVVQMISSKNPSICLSSKNFVGISNEIPNM